MEIKEDFYIEDILERAFQNGQIERQEPAIDFDYYDLSDKFGLTFNVGATSRRTDFERTGVASTGQNVFDVIEHFNFDENNEIAFSERGAYEYLSVGSYSF